MTNAKFLVLAATAMLAGCTTAEASSPKAEGPETTAKVESATVASRQVATTIRLTGQLLAAKDAAVASDVAGKIARSVVERGAEVEAGAPLVQIDARIASLGAKEARAQADAAAARAEMMQAELKRAATLLEQGAMNLSDHDRVRAEAIAAEKQAVAAAAMAERLEKGLADTTIRAPFAGMIAERMVESGEYVNPGMPVARVVQLDPLKLELAVPESELRHVKEGQAVEFEVAAWPGQTFKGIVKWVGPAVREKSRDLVVEAEVQNPELKLRPGMFAVANVASGGTELAAVPASAVRRGDQTESVFVIENGRLQERIVQLGAPVGEDVAVLAGLKPGETVVARATPELHDGQRVQ